MIGRRMRRRPSNRNFRRPPPTPPHPVDMLSELPDDLLSHILSFLSVEEAVKTKLLSPRWRDLYPANPTLQYGYVESVVRIDNFVARVSKAMQQFRAPKIKAFELIFCEDVGNDEDVAVKYARNVDEWVCRAFAMNVERFTLRTGKIYPSNGRYMVPFHLLHGVELHHLKVLNLMYCLLPPFTSLAGPLLSLMKLYLYFCAASIDTFEDMPSYCPNLETLTLSWCEQLPNMRHYLARFKCLKSLSVKSMELDLQIHDANITTLRYHGVVKSISLKGLNCLQSALISIRESTEDVATLLRSLIEGAPQLRSLSIRFCTDTVFVIPSFKSTFKYLTSLALQMLCNTDVLVVAKFLPIAPILQKLSIAVDGAFTEWSAVWLEEQLMRKQQEQHLHAKHYLHSHLKEIELTRNGFSFGKIEVELIINLLESATALEKVILNYCLPSCNEELERALAQYMPGVRFVANCGVHWMAKLLFW